MLSTQMQQVHAAALNKLQTKEDYYSYFKFKSKK